MKDVCRSLLVLCVFFCVAACTQFVQPQVQPAQGEQTMTTPVQLSPQPSNEHFIADTTQSQFGENLRVGAGNIWKEDYTSEDGTQTTGLTAGLWFFVRDLPDLNQQIRVHKGQKIELAGYQVTVIAIDQDGISINLVLPNT